MRTARLLGVPVNQVLTMPAEMIEMCTAVAAYDDRKWRLDTELTSEAAANLTDVRRRMNARN